MLKRFKKNTFTLKQKTQFSGGKLLKRVEYKATK